MKVSINKKIYKFLSFVVLALLAFEGIDSPARAATNVVVSGEDSDKNAVVRSSEIYQTVISQIKESLMRSGYSVIDEDMLAVSAGFRVKDRRPKTELIETLKVANESGEPKLRSRLAVIFAIFPQIKRLSMADRIESVRIRGDIYDMESLRSLSSFKINSKFKKVLSPNCDEYCISEALVGVSDDLAMELGDTLTQKLSIALDEIGGGTQGSQSGTTVENSVARTLKLELVRFAFPEVKSILDTVEGKDPKAKLTLLERGSSKRMYSYSTTHDMGLIEENIYEALEQAGIDFKKVKISMSPDEIRIENLGQ